ncbi:MAG TPA: hypothetical protein DHU96_11190 [Actinobacteria bacterium]|nr:hypothetical protein [Actinomycetota bacterium]
MIDKLLLPMLRSLRWRAPAAAAPPAPGARRPGTERCAGGRGGPTGRPAQCVSLVRWRGSRAAACC